MSLKFCFKDQELNLVLRQLAPHTGDDRIKMRPL